LLHGAPVNLASWRKMTPALTKKYTIVATDLRCYGDSDMPDGGDGHADDRARFRHPAWIGTCPLWRPSPSRFSADSFEHAVEAFSNVALTPAVHASFHIQYVDSANPRRDEAVVLATRIQLDF
jgi:hypothetical protein